MNARRFLTGWFFLLCPLLGFAAPPAAGGWLRDAALSSLMLRTVVQTPDGLLWVGTDDGVFRYDGTQLVALNALRRGGPALPPVPCNQLLPLPDGSLWLGTEAGLYCLGAGGTLRALPLPAPASSNHRIELLALAPGGRAVWVRQSTVGLRRYAPSGQPQGPLIAYAAIDFEAWPAPDGTLWVNSPGRTRQLSATGRLLGEWRTRPALGLSPVYDPAGRPWLLSTSAAYRPGPGGQLPEVVRWGPASQEAVTEAQRTAAGPVVLAREQAQQLDWTPGPDPRPHLRFAVPLPPWPTAAWQGKLRADRAGHWWVFDTGTRGCWHHAAAPAFVQALAGPGGRPYSVRSSVRLPDGRLLVSTYEAGILTQARDSPLAPLRRWPAARLPTGNAPVLMGIVPAPLGPGGDWLAAGAFPLLRFNPRTGQFAKLVPTDQTQAEVGNNQLLRDPATGRVWAGTRLGLYEYDPTRATFRPYHPLGAPGGAAPLAGRLLEDVCPDGRGNLWLAFPDGVEHLTLATGARVAYGPTAPLPRRVAVDGARCLYRAPGGRLWVGTRSHGLAVVEPGGRAHLVLEKDLPNAQIVSITPGPGGYLWLGTYQGVVRYHPGSGQLAVFTTAQGLASDECNARAAYVDPVDGSLLLGGVAGLHRIYAEQVPVAGAARPRLLLASYTTFNATAEASRTRTLLAPDAPPTLQLAPDQPLVDLHLALTNDLDPGRARYAYRVRGYLGGRWLGLGTTPQLRLQGLPPGRYTVEVLAETSQGAPAANALRLPLTVTAAWYNRRLTWGLAALAAALATGLGVYGWQRSRLRRLHRENALRARLAADLHDEVGTLLTRVTMQAELLRELGQGPAPRLAALAEDSRAAASTVRDIIWSVDAEADTLGALTDRIRDHLDATARATGRDLEFDGDQLPPDRARALPPAVRQHTYRIYQEALTNALKYSPPGSLVVVSLRLTPGLELTVTNEADPARAVSRAGQGLRNLHQRAALLRAELSAGPVPGGWQVRLRLAG